MPSLAFDRFYLYDELAALLQQYQAEYPNLVEISSIGNSFEGRKIWLATVTDLSVGKSSEKPAFWVDGNIHASEVSASTAALAVIDKLVIDPKHAELLKTHTFYVVPRLNPDGAEWTLESPPRVIRSSTRPYPYEEEDPYGLEASDLDGDGRILQIRIKDAHGAWKISEDEPRLMKRREPGETGGTYYRLMSEGLFHNFDGLTMRSHRRKEGLDMNRNFPSAWRLESDQPGSGPFPTSEPEVRASVEAVVARPNICGAVTFHTFSGVNLRPPSSKPDDDLPAEDVWTYQHIGKVGESMTGYPAIAVYHEFRYHPKEVITGVFDDWMYEHRGVYAWTTEIWSPQRQAGITGYKYIDWFREHPHADDIALLKWSDDKLEGKGFVNWQPFSHPQLGEVELGGWDFMYAFRNPPPSFLESEVSPLADWTIWQASLAPRLNLLKSESIPLGNDTFQLRVAVQNLGWLPTNVSKIAVDRRLVRGVRAKLKCNGEANDGIGSFKPEWLISGSFEQDGGQLAGWSHISSSDGMFGGMNGTDDIAVFDWIVKGPASFEVVVSHERAGVVSTQFTVGEK